MFNRLLQAGFMAGLFALASVAEVASADMGVFFDEQATNCTAAIEPFGRVDAHIFVRGEPGTQISGLLVRVELPSDVVILEGTEDWARDVNPAGNLDDAGGVDVIIQPCMTLTSQPLRIVSFQLSDLTVGEPRPDLEMALKGGVIEADSTVLEEPHLKICDPEDPEGYLELLPIEGLRATLNCSQECPCSAETAVRRRTWAAIKRLYMED